MGILLSIFIIFIINYSFSFFIFVQIGFLFNYKCEMYKQIKLFIVYSLMALT